MHEVYAKINSSRSNAHIAPKIKCVSLRQEIDFVMATWLVVLLFSIGAVLLFVAGMSLTLMIKGRHIDSEIATNRHMRERGITCAVHDARAGESDDCGDIACTDHNCSACTNEK